MGKRKIKNIIDEAQISLFDMVINVTSNKDIVETVESDAESSGVSAATIENDIEKEEVKTITKNNIDNSLDKKIVEEYPNAIRIIKFVSGRYGVEQDNISIYISKNGEMDYKREGRCSVLAIDQILYSKDVCRSDLTPIQERVVKDILSNGELNIGRVIKRNGDDSVVIITKEGNVLGVTIKGWLLEYEGNCIYDENEIVDISNFIERDSKKDLVEEITNVDLKINNALVENVEVIEEDNNEDIELVNNNEEVESINNNEDFIVGEEVWVSYGEETYLGTVCLIYNNGKTLNVIFDNKHTAFHISKVSKI